MLPCRSPSFPLLLFKHSPIVHYIWPHPLQSFTQCVMPGWPCTGCRLLWQQPVNISDEQVHFKRVVCCGDDSQQVEFSKLMLEVLRHGLVVSEWVGLCWRLLHSKLVSCCHARLWRPALATTIHGPWYLPYRVLRLGERPPFVPSFKKQKSFCFWSV